MVLDVEKDNVPAISLYKKLCYRAVDKFFITRANDWRLDLYRMDKHLVD